MTWNFPRRRCLVSVINHNIKYSLPVFSAQEITVYRGAPYRKCFKRYVIGNHWLRKQSRAVIGPSFLLSSLKSLFTRADQERLTYNEGH